MKPDIYPMIPGYARLDKVEPINESQKECVMDRTRYFVDEAGKIYHRNFAFISIDFDLKGRAAGMYRAKKNQRVIRYNPYIFAKYFEDNLESTVPHEVAHYVTDMMFGQIRPHGEEWREVMQAFGADTSRTCNYDLEGIPVRRYQHHAYHCSCMIHEITNRRHNKILKNKTRYFCKKCHEELIFKIANG